MSLNKKIKPVKKDSKNIKFFLKYLPCFLKGFFVTVIGILALGFTYYKLSEYTQVIYYITYLVFIFGGFVSGNSTHKKIGGRGIISGTLGVLPVSVVIYLILIITTFRDLSIISLLCPFSITIGGTLGGIVSSNAKMRY